MQFASTFADLSQEDKKELWALLALRHSWGIGPRRAQILLGFYGTALAAVEACLADADAWSANELLPKATATKFHSGQWRPKAKREWQCMQQPGCTFLFWGHPFYPDTLKEICDPPLIIYYKGNPTFLRGPAVGIVGARDCTPSGIAASIVFGKGLAEAGVAVISGMAKGIDRAAHLAGLEGPGKSIAVLGTGIDVVYPSCNTDLYDLLCREGLVLSEFMPGSFAAPGHFPVRNRLISGLSQGILVVEAAERSGSLITARLALEQGREVFAIPGQTLAETSEGCQELVRAGAKPVFLPQDILSELAPVLAHEAEKAVRKKKNGQSATGSEVRRGNSAENILATPNKSAVPWTVSDTGDRSANRKVRLAKAQKDTAKVKPAPSDGSHHTRSQPAAIPPPPLDATEQRVYALLGPHPKHIDELAAELGEDIAMLSGTLTLMEVKGAILRLPGMNYTVPGA